MLRLRSLPLYFLYPLLYMPLSEWVIPDEISRKVLNIKFNLSIFIHNIIEDVKNMLKYGVYIMIFQSKSNNNTNYNSNDHYSDNHDSNDYNNYNNDHNNDYPTTLPLSHLLSR